MSMRKRSLCAQALLGSRDMSAPPAMSDSERERGAEVTRSTCQASSFYASASNHISWSSSCISVTVAFLFNEAMLDICETHRPGALVAENVEGLKQKPPDSVTQHDHIAKGLNRAGYLVTEGDVNAVHFGLPQSRPRVYCRSSHS